jgi:hypothetical protein
MLTATMVAALDTVLAQALELPDEDRRALVAHLLDVGIAELDRGQGIESSVDEFMAEIDAAVGLAP